MKQWTISYLDKDGVPQSLELDAEQRPDKEAVAGRLRQILFPVADAVIIDDLQDKVREPTVKSLKDQNAVEIISIEETPAR